MTISGDFSALRRDIQGHLQKIGVEIGSRSIGTRASSATHDYICDVIESLGFTASTFESEIEHQVPVSWHCEDATGAIDILPGASTLSLNAVDASVMPCIYETADDFRSQPPEPGSIAVVNLGMQHESKLCELAAPAAAIAWFREGHAGLYSGNCKRPDSTMLSAGFAIDETVARRWTSMTTRVSAEIAVDVQRVILRSVVCDVAAGDALVPCYTAHYDTKPMAPGANDNASGVAVLLAMLANWPIEKPARFIFFDGEEIGVKGASAYVEHLEAGGRLWEIACVICPDSVGLGELHLYTADKYGVFPEVSLNAARRAFQNEQWMLPERVARSGGSDYIPFHIRGVPCVFLSDFPNHVRHTTADTVDHIDIDVLVRLARVLLFADWTFR